MQQTPRILTGGGNAPPLPGAGELSGYKNFKKDKKGVVIYAYI
nr:MAG TPA: hypothetical protein [Caudoviricetes sp.]DAJ55851.1 MAG TPA: hypothetical protein [Caudoviricetes sp.]